MTQTFVVEKKEGLLTAIVKLRNPDGTSQLSPEQVVPVLRQLLATYIVEEVIGVQVLIAEIFVSAAVILVGT